MKLYIKLLYLTLIVLIIVMYLYLNNVVYASEPLMDEAIEGMNNEIQQMTADQFKRKHPRWSIFASELNPLTVGLIIGGVAVVFLLTLFREYY